MGKQRTEQRKVGGLGKWKTLHLPPTSKRGIRLRGENDLSKVTVANQGLGPRTPDSQTSSRQPAAFCQHAVSFTREGILLIIVQLLLYDY